MWVRFGGKNLVNIYIEEVRIQNRYGIIRGTPDMAQNDKTNKIIIIDHPRMILGCIGLALGLAVLGLSLLKKIAPEHAVIFLALAVICFAVSLLIPRK